MHEDPTRRMDPGQGPQQAGYGQGGQPPPEPGMSGAHKALLALLAALVIGLGVALVVVAADSGGGPDETTTSATTATEITTAEPTTTTATTTATETTTTTTTTTGEDSGGTEAP